MFESIRLQRLASVSALALLTGLVAALAAPDVAFQARELCVYLMLVSGLSIFVSNSGVMSFGQMSFAMIGGYVSALLTASAGVKAVLMPGLPPALRQLELPSPIGVLIGVGAAMGVAAIVAYPLSHLSGIGASISTLALLAITYTVVSNWQSVTGGTGSFPGIPLSTNAWVYAGCALIAIVIAWAFEGSRYGLKLQASREDEPAARAIGVSVPAERRRAFVLSAAVMALGGAMYSELVGVLSPDMLYLDITFLCVAMLVVGGVNSIVGAVAGATALFVLNQVLRNLEGASLGPIHGRPGMTEFLLAMFMLLVMIFRPDGLTGAWSSLRVPRVRHRAQIGASRDLT